MTTATQAVQSRSNEEAGMTQLRQTPLCALQEQRGGRMVSFAGWRMAVQFAGVMAEHQAVRERVGLFDVSHMGELLVEGPQAQAAVQHVITNDVGTLAWGKALYTVMCTEGRWHRRRFDRVRRKFGALLHLCECQPARRRLCAFSAACGAFSLQGKRRVRRLESTCLAGPPGPSGAHEADRT